MCNCFRRGDLDTNDNVRTYHIWWRRSNHPKTFADLELQCLFDTVRAPEALDASAASSSPEHSGGDLSHRVLGVTEQCIFHRHQQSAFAVSLGLTDAEARAVARRAVLVHAVYRLWCSGTSHADCAALLDSLCKAGGLKYALPKDASYFRFEQASHGKRLSMTEQQRNLQIYAKLLDHWTTVEQRTIQLSGDDVERIALLEDHELAADCGARVLVGRRLAPGGQLCPVHRYRLSARPFIGTTSMDAELAFLMANVAGIGPGQTVLDPYVGTGSILIASAVLGASQVLGSDLDHWVLYGTSHTARRRHRNGTAGRESQTKSDSQITLLRASPGRTCTTSTIEEHPANATNRVHALEARTHDRNIAQRYHILDNFRFYGIPRHQWPELVRMDLLEPAWAVPDPARPERFGWCDAIVCDPPYGIREGTRQASRACAGDSDEERTSRTMRRRRAPFAAHLEALFRLAARVLCPGGRLVFWLPAVAALTAYDLPRHASFEYIGVPCCQRMRGDLRRYLLVLRKTDRMFPSAAAASSPEVFYEEAPPHYQRAHEDLAARLFRVAERSEQLLQAPNPSRTTVPAADSGTGDAETAVP